MLTTLAVAAALAAGAHSPHAAVQRFIQNRTPADACAQLAPAYQAKLAVSYGPCLDGMKKQPKATHIVLTHEAITGTRATIDAAYRANGSAFRERYTLVRSKGIWLITGSKQI